MFDVVGRPSPRSPARRAGALVLSLTVNGGLLGLALLIGAKGAEAVVVTEAPIERPVELVAPSLSEPPAPAGPPAARRRSSPAPSPAPVVAPPPLAPVEPSPEVAPVADGPPQDGDVLGDLDGPPGPPQGPGGPGNGPGGGGGGGGVKIVHWSEVVVKVRPQARPSDYPEAARALGLPGGRCTVRLLIDERGTPVEVTAKSCPEVFRGAAESVGMRYRFYPLKVDGRAVPAAFDLALNFVDG